VSRDYGSGFFPGDFGFVIITESAITTPEPSTLWLLGTGCVGGLLALLWSRKNMRASLWPRTGLGEQAAQDFISHVSP
jgi:hypothetical protein